MEVLKLGVESRFGTRVLEAFIAAVKPLVPKLRQTDYYRGRDDWLVLYGGGEATRARARAAHLASGGKVMMWDLGYFGRGGEDFGRDYSRLTINQYHPWRYLDATPADAGRWDAHGIALREDGDPRGHVVVIGMGRKSRTQFDLYDWEDRKIAEMRARFPGVRIVYRPKRLEARRHAETMTGMPIQDVLRGARLVVCRHSNVGLDACVAGVPVETEDGAAYWLYHRNPNPTPAQRLDFLRRVAHWQYRCDEMAQAWQFASQIVARGV